MTKKHSSAGIIAASYLDQGLSLRNAINLTLADHMNEGCRFTSDALEKIIASVKAHLCDAIEVEETACADQADKAARSGDQRPTVDLTEEALLWEFRKMFINHRGGITLKRIPLEDFYV